MDTCIRHKLRPQNGCSRSREPQEKFCGFTWTTFFPHPYSIPNDNPHYGRKPSPTWAVGLGFHETQFRQSYGRFVARRCRWEKFEEINLWRRTELRRRKTGGFSRGEFANLEVVLDRSLSRSIIGAMYTEETQIPPFTEPIFCIIDPLGFTHKKGDTKPNLPCALRTESALSACKRWDIICSGFNRNGKVGAPRLPNSVCATE